MHCHQPRRMSSYYTFPLFTSTQTILENIHLYSGLPWWVTIACTTILLRTAITLPLAIKQNKMTAKMELLKPLLKEVTDAVRYNIITRGQRDGKGKTQIQAELFKELRSYTKDFYQRNGINTWKLFMLPWIQLPLWITISFALRNISGWIPNTGAESEAIDSTLYAPATGVEIEGLLWFSNLSVADPYYVLPCVLLLTNLINIELNTFRQQTPSTMSRLLTNTFRGLTCLVFLISTQVPSAMSLYWATSSSYGLLQNIVMKFPRVRRHLNIPKTPSEQEKPIQFIREQMGVRVQRFLELQKKS